MHRARLFKGGLATLAVLFLFAACQQDSGVPAGPDSVRGPVGPINLAKKANQGDPEVLAMMREVNERLAAAGLNIAVEQIEFFTIGRGRPSNRIHQQPFRWRPNDANRLADGINITYMIDQTYATTASGLSAVQTTNAIRSGLDTWDGEKALKKVTLVERADDGNDHTLYDALFGYGELPDGLICAGILPGDDGTCPFFADIINAGWYPRQYFEDVGGPGGGDGILAFSVSFIFISCVAPGVPCDVNGDNYIDTAFNEVYYNDTFGTVGEPRENNPWGIDAAIPSIDVETVAHHENGHSLGLGHFGPPPAAVMNPVYAGILQAPLPPDHAGMAAVWGSWPNP
jgi:hypothetical protein